MKKCAGRWNFFCGCIGGVLLAAVVAIVVGWFNWLGRDDVPPPEPLDVPEREGLP